MWAAVNWVLYSSERWSLNVFEVDFRVKYSTGRILAQSVTQPCCDKGCTLFYSPYFQHFSCRVINDIWLQLLCAVCFCETWFVCWIYFFYGWKLCTVILSLLLFFSCNWILLDSNEKLWNTCFHMTVHYELRITAIGRLWSDDYCFNIVDAWISQLYRHIYCSDCSWFWYSTWTTDMLPPVPQWLDKEPTGHTSLLQCFTVWSKITVYNRTRAMSINALSHEQLSLWECIKWNPIKALPQSSFPLQIKWSAGTYVHSALSHTPT